MNRPDYNTYSNIDTATSIGIEQLTLQVENCKLKTKSITAENIYKKKENNLK